jgi:hypothetical protein
MTLLTDNRSGAIFSECRKYRYALWRIWDENKPLVMFIGLNPSTANETGDDPTIRRVKSMAKSWGYGGVYMMNLFAYVSTDPAKLLLPEALDKVNEYHLLATSQKCRKIIFAWGNFKEAEQQGRKIADVFPNAYALHINKNGSPKHPLYCRADVQPVLYNQIKNIER